MFWKESMCNVKQMSCKGLWSKCVGKNDGERESMDVEKRSNE